MSVREREKEKENQRIESLMEQENTTPNAEDATRRPSHGVPSWSLSQAWHLMSSWLVITALVLTEKQITFPSRPVWLKQLHSRLLTIHVGRAQPTCELVQHKAKASISKSQTCKKAGRKIQKK